MKHSDPSGEKISRSARKREARALQTLGEQLLELPPSLLENEAIPETIREAIRTVAEMRTRESRRRQIQRVGVLMRSVDPEPIRYYLAHLRNERMEMASAFRAAEGIRDALISEEFASIDRQIALYPDLDWERVRELAVRWRSHQSVRARKGLSRELFRLLHEMMRRRMAGGANHAGPGDSEVPEGEFE